MEAKSAMRRAAELFRAKQYEKALNEADKILALDPEVALSWRFKGECQFSLNRYQQAATSFAQARQLGGKGTEELILWQVMSLANAGNKPEAKTLLQTWLKTAAPGPLKTKAKALLARL